MRALLQRMWHRVRLGAACTPHLRETGLYSPTGRIPVDGIPTPCGGSGSGWLLTGAKELKMMECSVCGSLGWEPGRPAEVSQVYDPVW